MGDRQALAATPVGGRCLELRGGDDPVAAVEVAHVRSEVLAGDGGNEAARFRADRSAHGVVEQGYADLAVRPAQTDAQGRPDRRAGEVATLSPEHRGIVADGAVPCRSFCAPRVLGSAQ